MRKWVTSIFVLFLLGLQASARDEERFLSDFFLDESIDEGRCDQVQLELAAVDSATSVDNVPKLPGKWVSQECEVRPGPEFLLRSYSFSKNNSFRLVQYFYEDESCILPLHTVVARGHVVLKEPSWITPSGTRAEYALTRVTIIPHTTQSAERLSRETKQKCLDRVRKTWKPHREYIVYSMRDLGSFPEAHKSRKYKRRKIHRDVDCLSAVGLEFNELMLIRTQWRPVDNEKKNRELLLGDVHSQSDSRFSYKPTAFQVHLLKADQAYNCVSCRLVSKATERAPPHLLSKPQLPPLPHGQWVSQRCEVRPYGMFLIRRLSFDSRDSMWMGEYKFHADPFCTETAFAISASGRYLLGPFQSKEKFIRKRKTGTNFDFQIEEASLTLFDPTLRDTFNTETNCGVGAWQLGVAKDLKPTAGCSILGIDLPTTEYELIKLEIDSHGSPLLLMGLPDTENKKRNKIDRPTSYQASLVQCSVFPQQNLLSNHLEPTFNARVAPRSSALPLHPHISRSIPFFLWVLFLLQNL